MRSACLPVRVKVSFSAVCVSAHPFPSLFLPARLIRIALPFRLPSRLSLLAALVALLLLSAVVFYWARIFLAPRPPAKPAAAAAPALGKVWAEKAVHLFGGAGSIGAAVDAAPVAASAIGVSGVYAGRDGRSGFAVLVVDGKALPAVLGQEFAAGLRLQRVYPDSVEILRGGQLEIARMAAAPLPPPAPTPSAAKPGATTAAMQMAVQPIGANQYVLSRAALLTTLQRPDQIPLLGRYTPNPVGGALLEHSPAGGLPDKLGLKVGDVVTRINGHALSGPNEVARIYELMTKSEGISMDVLRAGAKINIGIQVEP